MRRTKNRKQEKNPRFHESGDSDDDEEDVRLVIGIVALPVVLPLPQDAADDPAGAFPLPPELSAFQHLHLHKSYVRETDERKGPIERFKRCDRTPLRELFLSSLPGIILVTVVWLDHCHIFNSKLVLGSPETATDADYAAILGVIGHECKFCGREGTVLMV
ncbi:hypothetical protein RHMOL_Rhmol02G0272800 [Rhododendron molle]|uniref:Uncharacterized protein n=2 Tax=Rhododendron molle TaxID=49168 RepID=A0ACC0PUC5_RHOML|nr:hypothetical protein RHMOL_Rhmol02G0272800 [Rhododendron molle]KAI8569362.1 hypothetical protein RHMOL_Rhmol02G0272800 [Rhododendron molle]